MPLESEIRIFNTPEELFRAASDEFVALANASIRSHNRFTVALSGGSTPKSFYALLARTPSIPWNRIYFFWGDERCVPPDHPDSNYRMAHEALLSKVPVPQENIFRIHGEDGSAAAPAYERIIQSFFQLAPGEFPTFDLIVLGLGPDGHTASLFPGTPALNEESRLVVANWVEKLKACRITLTYPVLNHAACVMFLVSGAEKAGILRELLEEKNPNLPAQRVNPQSGKLIWLLDRAAASELKTQPGN